MSSIQWLQRDQQAMIDRHYDGDVLAAIAHEGYIRETLLTQLDYAKGGRVARPKEHIADIFADICLLEVFPGDDGLDYTVLPADRDKRVVVSLDDAAVPALIANACSNATGRSLGRPALEHTISRLHAECADTRTSLGEAQPIGERRWYNPSERVLWVDTGELDQPYPLRPWGDDAPGNGPVHMEGAFVRGEGFAPLRLDTDARHPMPVPIEALLRPHLNAEDDFTWHTLLAALLGAWHPSGGPYYLLYLHGETGAAKTQMQEKLGMLIDPRTSKLERFPKDRDAVFRRAIKRQAMLYDNMPPALHPWFQDEICKLATKYEGQRQGRQFSFRRPVILSGLYLPANLEQDFRARMLALELPAYHPKLRDEVVWRRFNDARPAIQAALFDIIRYGLAHFDGEGEDTMSEDRLVSAADWLAACEAAIAGQAPGTFARTLAAHRSTETTRPAVDSSPDVRALVKLVAAQAGQEWSGTGEALCAALQGVAASDPAIGAVSDSATILVRRLNKRQHEIAKAHKLTWTLRRTEFARTYTFRRAA